MILNKLLSKKKQQFLKEIDREIEDRYESMFDITIKNFERRIRRKVDEAIEGSLSMCDYCGDMKDGIIKDEKFILDTVDTINKMQLKNKE